MSEQESAQATTEDKLCPICEQPIKANQRLYGWSDGTNGETYHQTCHENIQAIITTETTKARQEAIASYKKVNKLLENEIRIDELQSFNPFFTGDHTKCPGYPDTCIGYQNAVSDFENEREIRLAALQKEQHD